jgi:hypothetical protein
LGQKGHLASTLFEFVGVAPKLFVGQRELFLEVRAGRDVHDGHDDEATLW